MNISQELDDAARVVFMDDPGIGLVALTRTLRAQGITVTAREASSLWARYRGYEGRTSPTHDVETGRRLR